MSNASWLDAPVVELVAKRCPYVECGGRKFIHCWSADNRDDSRTQFQICARCSRRVKFVIVSPDPGIDDIDGL